ncbi:MAG: S24/S26 family peptidase, partial [Anaerolineae bacterium]|nr:S24/S26 family peptidase [Anaerolineae bacterium]
MNGESSWTEVLNKDWSGPLRLRVRGRSMWPTLRPGDQVTVESAATDHLQPGDWVLLQGREALFLHRFLGFTREGLLLTKGDGHRAPDSPWPPDALRGRAVAVSRQGRTMPVSPSSLRERARTIVHRLMAAAWTFLRHTGLLIFLLLGVSVISVAAAVTLNSFEAALQGDSVLITWETASEVDMAGFHIQRAPYVTPEKKNCNDVPGRTRINTALIPSKGDIIGASYAYTDTNVVAGSTYYYCLEAVETDGDRELHGPITVTLPLPPTTEPPP